MRISRAAALVIGLLFLAACSAKNVTPTADPGSAQTERQAPRAGEIQTCDIPDADDAIDRSEYDKPLSLAQQQALNTPTGLIYDLSVEEKEEFLFYFRYYTATNDDGTSKRGRQAFERMLKRSEPYMPYVKRMLAERNMPEALAYLPFAESGYNPWAYSRAGAGGMWQFMPGTGTRFGLTQSWWVDERRNPYKSTGAALDYLKKLYDMFGDWKLALAAYNAGEGNVARAIEKSGSNDYFEICGGNYLKEETRHYVPKLMAILKICTNLDKLGFDPVDWSKEAPVTAVTVPGGTDLHALAAACNLSWSEFSGLNPEFRRNVTPPRVHSEVRVPVLALAQVNTHLATAKPVPMEDVREVAVRKNDTWYRIAKRYGTSVALLKQVNDGTADKLRPGQKIMVPGKGMKEDAGPVRVAASEKTSPARTRAIAERRSNYVVRPGDTLYSISRKYDVAMDLLRQVNGMPTKASSLSVGQKLYIPSAGEAETKVAQAEAAEVARKVATGKTVGGQRKIVAYSVQKGDTLWAIARKFDVDPKDLLAWNNMTRDSRLMPGDTVKIFKD